MFRIRKVIGVAFLVTFFTVAGQESFSIQDYYPISDGNEWRYSAPEGWHDGDYISKIEMVPDGFPSLFNAIEGEYGDNLFKVAKDAKFFRHYDATKASKLISIGPKGILYHGETFSSDNSIAVFEEPIVWFTVREKIGSSIQVKRNYTRYYLDGSQQNGVFTLTQEITGREDITVPAGNFKDCLRIEFDTYWDLGEGMEAKSVNVYHHAKHVGVVKASARFIILKKGMEIINRLVIPDLKSYAVHENASQVLGSNIQRIKMATVITQDVAATKKLYRKWLAYEPREEGKISEQLANSWGCPQMKDRPFAVLQAESGDDVFLRIIEGTIPADYKAMTTYGWNAIELIVEDPDAILDKLSRSPFQHIGGPANLGNDGLSSIRAVQFKGPSEEVFYFTRDKGDPSKSSLLSPRSPIDRPFIMVVAGPDARELTDFYVSTFKATEAFFIELPIPLLSAAQKLPKEHRFPLALVRLGAFSNSIEIDGYSEATGPRPTGVGELPPGVSISSFSIKNLDLIDPELFIAKPIRMNGLGYDGNRSVTVVGPAGELIELIEEK